MERNDKSCVREAKRKREKGVRNSITPSMMADGDVLSSHGAGQREQLLISDCGTSSTRWAGSLTVKRGKNTRERWREL